MSNKTERSRAPQMTWWIAGSLIFIICAVSALMFIPDFLVTWSSGGDMSKLTVAEKVKAVTDARQGVLFAIGGSIAVITLLFTRAKHILEREKQSLDQDANWTGRYTEAITQLGEGSIAIRLGGIYALERIAQDSPRDRQTVLDVLCAYLRENSPVKNEAGEETKSMATDTAAAATVVGRIAQLSQPVNVVDLNSTDLVGAHLNGANLTRAHLNGANLVGAHLNGVNLIGAYLSGAILSGADLSDADLVGAILSDAILSDAILVGADLSDAILSGVNLTRAHLNGADLSGTDLTRAILSDANLSGVNLTRAHLNGADLSGTYTLGRKERGEEVKIFVTRNYLKDRHATDLDTVAGLPAEGGAELP